MPEPEPNPAEGQAGPGPLLSQPRRDIELFDVGSLEQLLRLFCDFLCYCKLPSHITPWLRGRLIENPPPKRAGRPIFFGYPNSQRGLCFELWGFQIAVRAGAWRAQIWCL